MALAEGDIKLDGGCLYLTSGGEVFLPVFPESEVRWKDGVLTYAGATYREGDRLVLGGGERDDLSRLNGLSIPANCRTTRVFVVAPGE